MSNTVNTPSMGKGSSAQTANPNPQNEDSVISSTDGSVPSSNAVANSLVDAAIGNFLKGWEGLEIMPDHVVSLGEQIKRLYASVSETPTPKPADPVFVPVPQWIINNLLASENGDYISVAVEAMYDALAEDPRFKKDPDVDYERVQESYTQIIKSTIDALRGRGLHIGPLDDDYNHEKPRALDPAPAVEPAPQKAPEVSIEKKPKVTLYDISRTTYLSQKVIQSDSAFFDMLTDQGDLEQLIENLSAWYSAWVQHIDESAGDIQSSHFMFPHIMSFLGRMMGAVAEVESKNDVEESQAKSLKVISQLEKGLVENGAKYREIIDQYQGMLDGAFKMVDAGQNEVVRLRNLYEPGQHPTPAEQPATDSDAPQP